MGQGHTHNSVNDVTGGKIIMAAHIETLNVHVQPEQNENVAVGAWARRIAGSSVWAHVRRNSNASSTVAATVGVVSDLATLRDKAEDCLREDPWLDSGLPIRFLEADPAPLGIKGLGLHTSPLTGTGHPPVRCRSGADGVRPGTSIRL